jgi:alkane 1-monooxygenase
MWILATKPMSISQYVGFTLALWIVCSLNTAIGHELIHSRSRFNRKLGDLLDATVGYFHFTEEHLSHHASNGSHDESDAAVQGTSIYVFAFRRYMRSLRVAWNYERARLKRMKSGRFANRLVGKLLIPIAIASIYYVFAGKIGLGIYLFQITGTAFSVQAITYLQHWGLSEKETPAMADYGYSWEDGCWMQACVTLNHAFHGQHHLNMTQPYFVLSLNKGGLSLPASYPVMVVVALFPTFFTRLMKDRLAIWIANAETVVNDSDCTGATGVVRGLRDIRASQ